MALHPTRRRFLTGVGLAGTAGTALLSPGRPTGSPDIDPTVSTGTWPLAGRSPARTKHAPNAAPPTTDARVVWSASSPLWDENRTLTVGESSVYAAGANGVTAVDAADGSVRWRFDVTDHWPSEAVDVTAGPAVADERVLVVTDAGPLALDSATGHVRWARAVDWQPRHAVLVGDALFLRKRGNGAGAVALDVATGGAWHRLETRDFLSPVAFVGGDLVALDADRLVCVDPRTGERRWQAVNPGTSHLLETAVAGTDRVVILGSNPLVAVDTDDGTEAWRYEARTEEDELASF